MGNNNVGGILHPEAKLAAKKFDTDEIHVLRQTWRDLADRNDGRGIDKDTFLQYFPLNGLLGERLFVQFDTKEKGAIDFEDFIRGLAIVCRGTLDDKIHFVFNMYDVSHDNTVSKQDLTTLLNHIPKSALGTDYYPPVAMPPQSPYAGGFNGLDPPDFHRSYSIDSFSGAVNHGHAPPQSGFTATGVSQAGHQGQPGSCNSGNVSDQESDRGSQTSEQQPSTHPLQLQRAYSHSAAPAMMPMIDDPDYEEDVDGYTNHDLVERAFAECDLSHEGRLSYEEFKMWVERTPSVLNYIESILPYAGPREAQPKGGKSGKGGKGSKGVGEVLHHDKKEALPHMHRITSRASLGGGGGGMGSRPTSLHDLAGDIFNHSTSPHPPSHAPARRAHRSASLQQLSYYNIQQMQVGGAGGEQSPMAGGPISRSSSFQGGGPSSMVTPTGGTPTSGGAHFHFNLGSTAGIAATATGSGEPGATFDAPASQEGEGEQGEGMKAAGGSNQDLTALHMHMGGNRLVHSPSVGGGGIGGGDSVYAQSNMEDPEETARLHLIYAYEATQNEALKAAINALLDTHTPGGGVIHAPPRQSEIYHTVVAMESYLWKKGKSMFHLLSRRYYLLSGNCMYYYTHKNDVRPKGVVFLTGSIITREDAEGSGGSVGAGYSMALKGYYGFEIVHQDLCTGEHHRHEKRVLYCKSEAEREKWVSALQHAAHVVPISDDYVIGSELGRGRFSVVCECVHKVTGVHCAVKIIDKATIEPEEKSLLRTEIAVLKLVNHPNIIRMEGLYESKEHIYIVMEMLKGGELFERIVGRPRFTEQEAGKLIRPLLESVAYLHDLGIVHRDLKPENILCGEELEDLKIADFGLSKMVMPKEKMDSACGTLSYVAPEVLTMQGYGKEADLWSVGVIMFLLMCGKLPFDGEDHNEIIRSTIQADLKVNPAVWAKLSEEAKSLMMALLNKNPKERISARDALKHPFITTYSPNHRRNSMSMQHPPLPPPHSQHQHQQEGSAGHSPVPSSSQVETAPAPEAQPPVGGVNSAR